METNDHNHEFNHEPLAYDEVEMLLPDYVFGALSADDRRAVEQALSLYPDLAAECAEMQAALASTELQELREGRSDAMAKRLRNLSYHVQERAASNHVRHRKRVMLLRWITPVLAACCALGVVVLPEGSFAVLTTLISSDSESAVERLFLRPSEEQIVREDNARNDGIVETDVSFTDNAALNDTNNDAQEKEALVAARMLSKETLSELSSQVSPFSDTFAGSGDLFLSLDDSDVDDEDVNALMKEIG